MKSAWRLPEGPLSLRLRPLIWELNSGNFLVSNECKAGLTETVIFKKRLEGIKE